MNWPNLPWHVTDGLKQSDYASVGSLPSIDPQGIAFLQYTSGSTALAKGENLVFANFRFFL